MILQGIPDLKDDSVKARYARQDDAMGLPELNFKPSCYLKNVAVFFYTQPDVRITYNRR